MSNQLSQVASLLKIVEAKLAEAKKEGPENLGSTVVRECLSSLNSATAILDRMPETAPKPPAKPKAVPKPKPTTKQKPAAAAEEKPKSHPMSLPQLKVDASDMEV